MLTSRKGITMDINRLKVVMEQRKKWKERNPCGFEIFLVNQELADAVPLLIKALEVAVQYPDSAKIAMMDDDIQEYFRTRGCKYAAKSQKNATDMWMCDFCIYEKLAGCCMFEERIKHCITEAEKEMEDDQRRT